MANQRSLPLNRVENPAVGAVSQLQNACPGLNEIQTGDPPMPFYFVSAQLTKRPMVDHTTASPSVINIHAANVDRRLPWRSLKYDQGSVSVSAGSSMPAPRLGMIHSVANFSCGWTNTCLRTSLALGPQAVLLASHNSHSNSHSQDLLPSPQLARSPERRSHRAKRSTNARLAGLPAIYSLLAQQQTQTASSTNAATLLASKPVTLTHTASDPGLYI